jgi:hypothetical protein
MSNYPNGFLSGVTLRGMPILQAHPGEVFWVSNAAATMMQGHRGGSNGNKGTFAAPFATIDYAIGRCTAGRGDIICVKPGHAETITTAGAIAGDVAGVAIVGLGTGSARPGITFGAAAATMALTAANLTFNNIRFVSGAADGAWITLSAAADGCSFENCDFVDTSTVLNFLNFITLTSACDNISFNDCYFDGKSASNDSFILMGALHDRFYMKGCHMQSDIAQTSVVGLIKTTGDVTNCWIRNSFFRSNIDGALFIDFDGTACSGAISECYFSSINTAGATSEGIDFTGGHVFECYVSGEANAFGLVGGGGVVYNDA